MDVKNQKSHINENLNESTQNVEPVVAIDEEVTNFEVLGLKENLLRGIYAYGFEFPSTIQSKTIKHMITKREIVAQSQSGTGKTGAFAISTLELINEKVDYNQAIILAPTRELAIQIKNVIVNIGSYMKIKVALCIGGIGINENRDELKGAQIIVGTPGRTYDMIRREYINSYSITLVILDEADEMLSGDFKSQIKNIVYELPKETQICLFSATITGETLKLTDEFMRDPLQILIRKEELTLEGIRQFYINVEKEQYKFDILCDIYSTLVISQSIVYVNTKNKADWIKEKLKEKNFTVGVIHSEMLPNERSDILKEFRNGANRVLVSTDLLSRGIDIQQVSIVINYDLPNNNECYIHRIGRSGRYGRKGIAINFITYRDKRRLKEIEDHYGVTTLEMPTNIEEYMN